MSESNEVNSVDFTWKRRMLALLQDIAEKILWRVGEKLKETSLSEDERRILKNLQGNLPEQFLVNLPDEQQTQFNSLLDQKIDDLDQKIDDSDRQIFEWIKQKLPEPDRQLIGTILHDHLLIANAVIRYHGIMTIAEGQELLEKYPLPSARRAIQRLYEATFNNGLRGRELFIRTRRGSAPPSDPQPLHPTRLID